MLEHLTKEQKKTFDQKYFTDFENYMRSHAKEPIGLYELTNRAIDYCQEKAKNKKNA